MEYGVSSPASLPRFTSPLPSYASFDVFHALTLDIRIPCRCASRSVTESDWNCRILEINTDRDHVHILFEAPPQVQPSKITNSYKTVTSRLLRKDVCHLILFFIVILVKLCIRAFHVQSKASQK